MMHQPQRGQPAVVPAPPPPAPPTPPQRMPPPSQRYPHQTPSPLTPLRLPCTPPRRLPVVARPAARRTACAEQVPELPATPLPHRYLDEDPASLREGGGKGPGGGRQSRLTLLPARPNLTAHVVCVLVALCTCVRACVRLLSQTPLILSNPMHYPSDRASCPAAVQFKFCNTCLGVRPVAELKDTNTSP